MINVPIPKANVDLDTSLHITRSTENSQRLPKLREFQ
jgi:hypothetical protein